ncbi:isoleucine--tRNA ligase [Chloroflexota bacterium]
MFHPVGSKANFPQIEEGILNLWRKNNVFERSIDKRQGAPRFVLYEGPPTANGSPGIHHVLSRVFKDVIPRYKAMKGYYTPRIAGWDTHGLPVELEVEKELGFSGKAQIEEFGVGEFNARCRESVFRYLKEWNALTERIAFWVDLDDAYVTMKNEYIETVWWAIKQMWDKGLVYQGYKVTPHCPRCGTSLSSHEVALGYQDDVEDPSIYVKFKVAKSLYASPGFLERLRKYYGDREADFARWLLDLVGHKDVYLLAWTTTPWTLPGNTALAVAPDAEYAVVEVGDEHLILADALREQVGLGDIVVVAKVKGRDLDDLRYEPLFNPVDFGIAVSSMGVKGKDTEPSSDILWKKGGILNYPVIEGDFVSMEEGTGIVHVAPAYGEVDYEVGYANSLDFVHMVDLQGNIIGNYPFSGKFVKDADLLVLEELKKKNLLFRSETIRHTYPFCWRCEAPLLYYAKQTWYIRTTAVKESLIAGNNEINWYPEHIKHGRFGDWLENNVDWAFSRERYWGTPLPVWRCENPDCGNLECVGGVAELKGKSSVSEFKEPLDLHRPFVDAITFSCSKCGSKMRRVSEVIDCWFDSGAMPVAQHHYPFENESLLEDGRFPADYICEAVDQTRGWFYSLHAISTLLFNRSSFKNVICLGHILDAKGEKMSKARGNVVEPWAIINKYGADALRWYFFTAAPPGNVRRFDEKLVAEVTRRFLLTLWNVYSFFITYANIDHFTPDIEGVPSQPSELDRWVISELNQLIIDVDSALDRYNPTEAGRKIESFVDELSNWYVRRSRRRFWKSENDADKLAAYSTLYQCLVTLSKLLAPFTPFLAEELYQNLVCSVSSEAPESVHLTDFPVVDDEGKIAQQLSADVRLAIKISSLGRAARSKAGIKVRQPLGKAVISVGRSVDEASIQRFKSEILDELNVKDLEVKVGGFLEVSELCECGFVVSGMESIDKTEGPVLTGVVPLVAIPRDISPELANEGMAREIVHRLQIMRRSAGFDIADHIVLYYQGDPYMKGVMDDDGLSGYVKQETLSREIVEGVPEQGVFTENYRLGGHDILLGVKRLD